jgi:hypothetical protein
VVLLFITATIIAFVAFAVLALPKPEKAIKILTIRHHNLPISQASGLLVRKGMF